MSRTPKEPTLALGDRDLHGNLLSVAHARKRFLRAVERLAPAIIRTIPTDEADIQPWATQNHLTDQWVIDVAIRTLVARTHYAGHFRDRWCLTEVEAFWFDPIDDDTIASPLELTRQDYLSLPRARGDNERQWDARVRELDAQGFPRAVRRQQSHFEWTAKFQVVGKSYSQIARERSDFTVPATIEQAVKSLARFIGLTLRPTVRGGRRTRRLTHRRPSDPRIARGRLP